MLCIWIPLLCCSLACGGQAFDWAGKIADSMAKVNEAENNKDIPGMMATVSDDVTSFPSGSPPIRGKQALQDSYEQKLDNGLWPIKNTHTFKKIIAECDTLAVAELSEDKVRPDGSTYKASGVGVFRRDCDGVKLIACARSSDGTVIDPNAT